MFSDFETHKMIDVYNELRRIACNNRYMRESSYMPWSHESTFPPLE